MNAASRPGTPRQFFGWLEAGKRALTWGWSSPAEDWTAFLEGLPDPSVALGVLVAVLDELRTIRTLLDPEEQQRRAQERALDAEREKRSKVLRSWWEEVEKPVRAIVHQKVLAAFKGLVHESKVRGSLNMMERHVCERLGSFLAEGERAAPPTAAQVAAALAEAHAFDPLHYDYGTLGLGPQTRPRVLRLVEEARSGAKAKK